ncbi:Crp/Fnr family transcriptional regulator [Devosia aurantiaca]|uniref:Crp/Fnr family transcriptional regulator n=1 Tax=Devosia aurantiaca TaxID=2714858 RepID=A0A6M1SPL9_9HYPH|nr:Crp/Fnr family transcriptional regulator [Devosia aurantiaca]NGP18614.1 Crp/Fnr family transcriptional regulator [Devosia aurantiaca]
MTTHGLLKENNRGSSDRPHNTYTFVVTRRFLQLLPGRDHEAAALAALIEGPFQLPSHSDIHTDGRPASEAVVLLEGLACQYRLLDSARRQMVGFITPGDFCDFGFLSNSPVRQRVMTLGPATIGRIDLAQLGSLSNSLPNIILAGMRAASIQHAAAQELIVSLGTRDAQQRLAHLLCEIYTRLSDVGCVEADGKFDFALTQSELGEALGLSNVHVNRTIQQLRKQNLIAMSRSKVTMLNFAGLAKIASFSPAYLRVH